MKNKKMVIVAVAVLAFAITIITIMANVISNYQSTKTEYATPTQDEVIHQEVKDFLGSVDGFTDEEIDEILDTPLTEEQVEQLNKVEEDTYTPDNIEPDSITEVNDDGSITYVDSEGHTVSTAHTDYQKEVANLSENEFNQYVQESVDGSADPNGLIEATKEKQAEAEQELEYQEHTPEEYQELVDQMASIGFHIANEYEMEVITTPGESTGYYDPNWKIGG